MCSSEFHEGTVGHQCPDCGIHRAWCVQRVTGALRPQSHADYIQASSEQGSLAPNSNVKKRNRAYSQKEILEAIEEAVGVR